LIQVRGDDKPGVWSFLEKDLPKQSNGKIDVAKLNKMLNRPDAASIAMRVYNQQPGDTFIVGRINGSSHQNVLQFGLKGFDDLDELVQTEKCTVDPDLTAKLQ